MDRKDLEGMTLKQLTEQYNLTARLLGRPAIGAVLKCSKDKAASMVLAIHAEYETEQRRPAKAVAFEPKPGAAVARPLSDRKPNLGKGKKADAPAKPAESPKTKKQGVGKFCLEQLGAGKTVDETLDLVHAKFPEARTTKACVAWYKSKLRSAA